MKQFLFLFILCFWGVQDIYSLTVSHIRVDSYPTQTPVDREPLVSWWIESSERGCYQTSYRITIEANEKNGDVVYDTGEVFSSTSINIPTTGFQIKSLTRYYINVEVCDNYNNKALGTTCFDSGLVNEGWSGALWITSKEAADNQESVQFRKQFITQQGKTIKAAYICTSALGVYDLYVNSQRVGHHQDGKEIYEELKPGWTEYRECVSYASYDITSYVKEGGLNIIGAIVAKGWWRGRISWELYGKLPLCLISKLVIEYNDGTKDVIISDNTWYASTNNSLQESDIFDGETYDANFDNNWGMPTTEDPMWTDAIIFDGFKGQLEALPSTPFLLEELELKPQTITVYNGVEPTGTEFGSIKIVAKHNSTPFTLKKGETAIIDFGQNMAGWTPFSVKGSNGTKFTIRYAEMLNDSGSEARGNDGPQGSIYTANLRNAKATLNYILKGSECGESYTTFSTYYGFRYCEITASDDVIINELKATPISSAVEETGFIETDNAKINKLISNIKWGQRSNFVSIPTDCPQRNEKRGWTGDAQVFCQTGMYNFSTEAFYNNYIKSMRDSQRKDGAYPDVAPYGTGKYGNAGWGDAGIIIPWITYVMYGNKEMLKEHYPSMEKYMDWLSSQGTAESKYLGAGDAYGDWLAYDKCDNRYVSMAYYAYTASLMYKISKALSETESDSFAEKAVMYHQLFEEIKKDFIQRYWIPEPREKTQTSLCLALSFKLLDEELETLAKALLKQTVDNNGGKLSTGFIGTPLLLPTLSTIGLSNYAYNLLLQKENPSWLYSLNQGATTIWERWDSYTIENGFGPASMNSFNHYAYGAVGEWLYKNMAGIQPDEEQPGFKSFCLKPEIYSFNIVDEGINEVKTTYFSKSGIIKSNWLITNDGGFNYSCNVPANTTATLLLPISDVSVLFEGDVNVQNASGVTIIRQNADGVIFLLESGNYFFHNNTPTSIDNKDKNTIPTVSQIDKDLYLFKTAKEIYIYNMIGSLKLHNVNADIVDISSFPSGIYIMNVINERGFSETFKVVKE